MLKRLTYLLTLSLALPAFANAATWTVKATSAQPSMGSVSPSGYQNFTDNTAKTFTITANTGSAVSKVLLNNVDQGAVTSVSVPPRSTMQTLTAYFIANTFQVTAVQAPGGAITSTTGDTVAYGKSKTFTIKPNVGNKILTVTDGATAVTVSDPTGMTYTVSNVTANHQITAVFGGLSAAEAGPDQTVLKGSPVSLSGSGKGTSGTAAIASWAWSVKSMPNFPAGYTGTGYAFTGPTNVQTVTFTPDLAGMYVLELTCVDLVGTILKDTVNVSSYADATALANQCGGCHFDGRVSTGPDFVHKANTCSDCHSNKAAPFQASTHWNNHLETGPEFTDPGTGVNGVLNANLSYTTKENGVQVTCSIRCHFMNITQKGVYGCNSCHSDGLLAGGKFKNASSAHKEKSATYQNTCLYCHSGSKHGKVPNELWASKHWQSNFEYGPEFANQMNTTVVGGIVTSDGSTTNGVLSANDSYTTTENGALVTCAYRCHFRPGMGLSQNVGTVLANGKSTGYITYTDTLGNYGPVGTVYSRPGGDACMACHDSHNPDTATAQSTCYTCHSGNNHGWSVKAFEKSTHFTGTYAKLEGVAKESCLACHNSHSTEAEFANMSTASILHTAGVATGCQKCHNSGSPYGIFNADQTGKAPHFQTGSPDAGGYYPTASFITAGGATCADCHYHNNSMNAGWAEGGHGSLTAVPWKSDANHNWNGQGTDGIDYKLAPQKTNCIRCHSARGFAQYWDSGFSNIGKVYLDPVAKTLDKASAPLVCSGCHTSYKGAVRPLPTGFTKVKSFYGYSTVSIAPAKMIATLEFTDNKNSNICIPCHSQRAAGSGIKALFAQGAFKQYSVGTNMYPHAAQPAAIVDGKGGYEFTSAQGYQDRMRHIRIGNYGSAPGYNNTGITSGNCAGCHMTSTKTHSLEAVTADAATGQINGIVSTVCAKCHPVAFTYQDIQAKKDEFNAAVAALGNLLVKKGFTLDGVNVLPERKPFDMSRGTKDNAIAEKNTGAWFNWYLFKTADTAAYVHNPAYSRRLIFDSIDWLDDNVTNNSSANTVLAMASTPASPYYNPTVITTQTANQAVAQLNNPGCMGCHFGTGSSLTGEAVPGVEQAPHYNTTGALVPGQTFTQAQFVTPSTQCNYCHGYGHGTDSPSYGTARASKATFPSMSTASLLKNYAESAHGDTNGLAWTDYDFKTRTGGCVVCHTTTGFVKGVTNNFAAGVSAAFGTAGDATKQVLGCDACHSSTTWKTSVRTISGGFNGVYGGDYGAAPTAAINYVQFKDVGESNICIPCHAARENGTSLANGVADFTNASFKNPHYLAAAAVFYGNGGYQWYTGNAGMLRYKTYGAVNDTTSEFKASGVANGTVLDGRNAGWSHGKLGMGNYSTALSTANSGRIIDSGNKGQCVSCHLGPANTHTFGAAETALSTTGTNTTTLGGCYGCHTSEPIAELIEGEKLIFDRVMDFFDWTLKQNNMIYTDAYPYFQNTAGGQLKNWTLLNGGNVGPATGTGAQNMGAALNFKLLKAEKGAHVHNRSFARALIFDSVQYLQNGAVSRPAANADPNRILNFSSYSTARTAAPDANPTSITQLKGYLTRLSGGLYTAR